MKQTLLFEFLIIFNALALGPATSAIPAEGPGILTTPDGASISSDEYFMPLSYEQLSGLIDSMEKVTKNGYLRTLTGRKVHWQGWVYRVSRSYNPFKSKYDGYSVYVDMRRKSGETDLVDPWEVELKIPEHGPLDARDFRENEQVSFSGTIELARFLVASKDVKVTLQDVVATAIPVTNPDAPEVQGKPYRILFATSVHSEPTTQSREISRLGSGNEVSVLGEHGDWLEIRSRHGLPSGFINKAAAEPLEDR